MNALFDAVMVLDWPVLAAGLAAIVFIGILLKRLIARFFR